MPSPDSSGYPTVGVGSERRRWNEEYERIAGKASDKNYNLYAFRWNQIASNKNNKTAFRRSQIAPKKKLISRLFDVIKSFK